MKTARVNRHGQVSIPAAVRKAVGVKEGDQLGFEVEGNTIRVSPIVAVPKDQLWFYTRTVQKKIQKTVREMNQRKGRSFSKADDLIQWLKS